MFPHQNNDSVSATHTMVTHVCVCVCFITASNMKCVIVYGDITDVTCVAKRLWHQQTPPYMVGTICVPY